jgi:predicted RNase H-like nuclease (RuvC/YqgF family)
MSTKKKVGISDLLRDEVQKETEAPVQNQSTEQTIEVKAETVSDAISKITSVPNSQKTIENSPSIDEHTKARISELERSLAQSQQREVALSQTVAELEKDLKFSHTNVELLQKSLAAIESLKNELDQQLVEVKRDNLRLAEANIQLSEQVKALDVAATPVSDTSNSSQLVSQTPQNNSPNNRATPRKQPVDQPYAQRDRSLYARPTGSNEQLQRINNKNIGWMD